MREIKNTRLFCFDDIPPISNMLDLEARRVDTYCCGCGNHIVLDQMYISEYQQIAVDEVIYRLNSFMESLDEAVREIYGADIKAIMLGEKFQKLKNEFMKPNLQVIK